MQIYLKEINGKHVAIDISSQETVLSFKTKVSRLTNIPIKEFYLVSQAKILEDKHSFHFYKLSHGKTVSLNLAIKGGGCVNSSSRSAINAISPNRKKIKVSTSLDKNLDVESAAENTLGRTPQNKAIAMPNSLLNKEFKDPYENKYTLRKLHTIENGVSQILYEELLNHFLNGMQSELTQWINKEMELREQKLFRDSFRCLSLKSFELLEASMYEAILRGIVEHIINESKLDFMVESLLIEEIETKLQISKSLDRTKKLQSQRKSVYEERLSKLIYEELLTDFTNGCNLNKVAENLISACQYEKKKSSLISKSSLVRIESVDMAEDYINEMFTPGEHSPNEYSLNYGWEEAKVNGKGPNMFNEKINNLAKPKYEKGKNTEVPHQFNLRASTIIELSNERVEFRDIVCEQMLEIGNRQCLLNGILNIFGNIPKNSISVPQSDGARLQEDITNMLEIINSADSYNFTSIKGKVLSKHEECEKFLHSNKLSVDLAPVGKSSISVLDLSFKWKSCSDSIQSISGRPYRFLCFNSNEIEAFKLFNLEIYKIPTSQPSLAAVFIQSEDLKGELKVWTKRNRTDIYSFFEDIFANFGEKVEAPTELWIPVFRKQINYNIPWIEGYEIPPQGNGTNSQFIKKCKETVDLEFNANNPPANSLQAAKQRGKIMTSNFIFGLTNPNANKGFSDPLFLCLVEQKDLISAG
ncbi:unnamed protein product [Blepharisma stoltei]|uniref:Ubiquitin-like domain-containing protein n=1 Tax=Blepharisma stoltei TaxID=1481888 RepID=A0AAU9I9A1_9CILI|nr:unnamed protein product [Blepharisma stoltei]